MAKLVVNHVGIQQLFELPDKAVWNKKQNVVYDSRVDAHVLLDERKIGGLSRIEEEGKLKSLAFDQATKDANDAKIQADLDAKQAKIDKRENARNDLKALDEASTLPELKAKVQSIIDLII